MRVNVPLGEGYWADFCGTVALCVAGRLSLWFTEGRQSVEH
ncbi:hypothetical protein [Streptomyces sp. NPDC056160]